MKNLDDLRYSFAEDSLPKGRTTMSEKPRSKSAQLQELIQRRDKVLAVLHPPSAAHARIMEKAGCEALFVGTGGVVRRLYRPGRCRHGDDDRMLDDRRLDRRQRLDPGHGRRRY